MHSTKIKEAQKPPATPTTAPNKQHSTHHTHNTRTQHSTQYAAARRPRRSVSGERTLRRRSWFAPSLRSAAYPAAWALLSPLRLRSPLTSLVGFAGRPFLWLSVFALAFGSSLSRRFGSLAPLLAPLGVFRSDCLRSFRTSLGPRASAVRSCHSPSANGTVHPIRCAHRDGAQIILRSQTSRLRYAQSRCLR